MIRGLCTLVVLLVALTSQASAQATVKAGEHADFSRLVVYFPKTQSWTFEKTDSGYKIALEDWAAGFDVSTVFDLIPRTRIASLDVQSATLELEIACQCEASAEQLESGGAIIDVKARPDPDPIAVQAVPDVPELPSLVGQEQQELIATTLAPSAKEPAHQQELEAFRRSLLENLGQSASLSLVELDAQQKAPTDTASMPMDAEASPQSGNQTIQGTDRLRITSALEAALADGRLEPAAKVEAACPNSDSFDIAQWSDDALFHESIGTLRNEILGEFDEPNGVAIRALVQFYLHYGLGAEAKAVMGQFKYPNPEREMLTALAEILEPPLFGEGNTVRDLSHCDARIAIWAMLAPDAKKVSDPEKTKAIVSEFAAWPIHLRALVGPRLVAVLTENGEKSAAAVVSSIIERPGGKPSSELAMVSARAEDHQAYSVSDLLGIVNEGGDNAPEALKYYLLRMMADDRQIDPDLLELTSAYAKELTGLPVGNSLGNLHVIALAYSGQFEKALTAYRDAEAGGWAPEDGTADQMSVFFGQSADSDELARLLLLLRSNEQIPKLRVETTDLLAARFIEDGMPELAEELLRESLRQDTSPKLAADVARALGRSDEAISILRAAPIPDTETALVELMLLDGQAEELWGAMADILPTELKEQAAWSASQWDAIESEGPKRTIAQLMTRIPEFELESSPLATAAALRESSETAREAISDLLDLNSS